VLCSVYAPPVGDALPQVFADVLEKVSADQFALELQGPLAPGVFKPIGDDRYVHVVMPVRTTS